MKTIKDFITDKAAEIVDEIFSETVDCCPMVEAGIGAGIKEAERWISVSEGLPAKTIDVLLKDTCDRVYVGFFSNSNLPLEISTQQRLHFITHWRQINRK